MLTTTTRYQRKTRLKNQNSPKCHESGGELEDYNDVRCVWNADPNTFRTPQPASTFGLLDEIMASNLTHDA